MDITVTTAFLTKLSEFEGRKVEIFVEVWFWLYGATLMANLESIILNYDNKTISNNEELAENLATISVNLWKT